jgi:hypothetical protein
MARAAFDTLEVFETLEKAGFEEPKAKAISVVVRRAHESSDFATKKDIDDLRKDIDSTLKEMDSKLDKLKLNLIIWLGSIVFLAVNTGPILPKLLGLR